MPAQPLTQSQLADAERLSYIFKEWQERRKKNGKPSSQEALAPLLGFGQSAFSQYKNGDIPLNVSVLVKMCSVFECSPEDISPALAEVISGIAEIATPPDTETEHAGVRMIDAKASAGQGSLVFSTDVLKTLMFRRDFLAKNGAKPDDVIAFSVKGDSMVDAHITDGSVVIANLKKTEPVSKRFYVLWLDGELFVKQLVQKSGRWYARSHNKAKDYQDIEIDIDDRIVGRAFWCGFSL